MFSSSHYYADVYRLRHYYFIDAAGRLRLQSLMTIIITPAFSRHIRLCFGAIFIIAPPLRLH